MQLSWGGGFPRPPPSMLDVQVPPRDAPVAAPIALGGGVSRDLSGEVLGERYRLLRPLGHGGMATVYEAEHVEIEKRVAVKVLGPEHARCKVTTERFLREAKAASRLGHEHIIDI